MLRRVRISAAAAFGLAVAWVTVCGAEGTGSLGTVPLPGGLQAALAALDDPVPGDHSQFLAELIRRTHQRPRGPKGDRLDPSLRALLGHLEGAAREATAGVPAEVVPLPLRLDTWNTAVFRSAVAPEDFVHAMLRTRDTSLLYLALLSLDHPTRAWLESEPGLLGEIAARHAPGFLLAAPGVRISGSALHLPGGERAKSAWQALVDGRADEPASFLRALLARSGGRLAYFLGEVAQLSDPQLEVVLQLSADEAARTASLRRLFAIYQRLLSDVQVTERTFSRLAWDPGTLAAELRTGARGEPLLPGNRQFWTAVFASQRDRAAEQTAGAIAAGDPPDFPWLAEQVFSGDAAEQERRLLMVLFASRVVGALTPENAAAAVAVVRAAAAYPALTATLERAGVTDLGVIAAAAQGAARLAAIRDDTRATRAIAQFQGALALLARAASRRSIPRARLPALVTSLAAVNVTDRGDYEGAMVVWVDTHLREAAAAIPTDDSSGQADEETGGSEDLVRLLAGLSERPAKFVEWEGTRYRLDPARAEALRISRLLEPEAEACLSSARALVKMAQTASTPGVTSGVLEREAAALDAITRAVGVAEGPRWARTDVPARFGQAADALQRASRGRGADAVRAASMLRLLADDLLARGLMELVYVMSMGQPELAFASSGDMAGRHDFGVRIPLGGRQRVWRLPTTAAETSDGRRVTGALLAADVALADFSLRRVSMKPPSRRPTIDPESRRLFVETIALIEPAELDDASGHAIASAVRRGRERVAEVSGAEEVARLAKAAGLSAIRRNLLEWTVEHRREDAPAFLSVRELFWAGYEGSPARRTLDNWGVATTPRTGCLCLQVFGPQPWETLAGRWSAAVLASAMPDLNLRLAELLDELRMPAALLGPVLAAATLEFVTSAQNRDRDDYRGLVVFAQTLQADRVEEYLALLTTDGPLVPVSGDTKSEEGR